MGTNPNQGRQMGLGVFALENPFAPDHPSHHLWAQGAQAYRQGFKTLEEDLWGPGPSANIVAPMSKEERKAVVATLHQGDNRDDDFADLPDQPGSPNLFSSPGSMTSNLAAALSVDRAAQPTNPAPGTGKKGKPEEPSAQELQALVAALGAQLEDLKTDHKTELDDITAELNQAKKEGKSTHDTLFRTNCTKNEAEKKLKQLKEKVEALELELASAKAEINNQATWVTLSEGYRQARESLKAEVGDLKTTLANQKDQASSSSQKSAATESQLRDELQKLQEEVILKQALYDSEKKGRTVAVRRLNKELSEALRQLEAEERAHSEATAAAKRMRESGHDGWQEPNRKRPKQAEEDPPQQAEEKEEEPEEGNIAPHLPNLHMASMPMGASQQQSQQPNPYSTRRAPTPTHPCALSRLGPPALLPPPSTSLPSPTPPKSRKSASPSTPLPLSTPLTG